MKEVVVGRRVREILCSPVDWWMERRRWVGKLCFMAAEKAWGVWLVGCLFLWFSVGGVCMCESWGEGGLTKPRLIISRAMNLTSRLYWLLPRNSLLGKM